MFLLLAFGQEYHLGTSGNSNLLTCSIRTDFPASHTCVVLPLYTNLITHITSFFNAVPIKLVFSSMVVNPFGAHIYRLLIFWNYL